MKTQRTLLISACCASIPVGGLHAQITISASDLFNVPGQYYRAYANTPHVSADVGDMLGVPSGEAQAWNFLTGPQEVVYRFDYKAAGDVPQNVDFPLATLAEQKTDEAGVLSPAWLFFSQDPARGRVVYGFYDPGLADVMVMGIPLRLEPPAGFFQSPLRDFPHTISMGDEWSSTTIYTNLLTLDDGGDGEDESGGFLEIPQQTTYAAAAKVDAFGIVNSPGIGFGECLRINELVQYDLAADFGTGFEPFGTAYIRNYYWVRPGRGIVAQITSEQHQGTIPPDNFQSAAIVLRMFETNHPDGGPPPPQGIQGLAISLSNQGALLMWTRLSGMTSYQVQYATDPAGAGGWVTVGSATTANFLVDISANGPGARVRYYRVVGLK